MISNETDQQNETTKEFKNWAFKQQIGAILLHLLTVCDMIGITRKEIKSSCGVDEETLNTALARSDDKAYKYHYDYSLIHSANGVRTASKEEFQNVATNVAQQIKVRGPFLKNIDDYFAQGKVGEKSSEGGDSGKKPTMKNVAIIGTAGLIGSIILYKLWERMRKTKKVETST